MDVELKKRISEILYKKIVNQIHDDLTILREDNNLKPYNEEKITNFLKENEINIQNTIEDMIATYEDEDELNDLLVIEDDCIREFLYEYVEYKDE